VPDASVLENIQDLWKKFIKQELSQVNIDQALVPSKAKVLMNRFGSAPGMWLEKNSKVFISLPGVPFEMKALIENEVIPKLQSQFKLPYILHKTLITYGLGESRLAERIEKWEDNLPNFIKLAYLPSLGRVRLRLSAKGNDKDVVVDEMEKQIAELMPQVEDIFVGFEEEHSIEAIIGKKLAEQRKTLAIAESCTGGKISERITSVPGASMYYKGCVVSYATQSKIDILRIDAAIIDNYSLVSTQLAEAMARQAQLLFDSDYAISTTGNAGPTRGDDNAEVGTVCIALATPKGVFSEEFHLGNHRTKVINKAVNKAFELLQKEIFKN
jgi:nicotinamide-nucleotide amidase